MTTCRVFFNVCSCLSHKSCAWSRCIDYAALQLFIVYCDIYRLLSTTPAKQAAIFDRIIPILKGGIHFHKRNIKYLSLDFHVLQYHYGTALTKILSSTIQAHAAQPCRNLTKPIMLLSESMQSGIVHGCQRAFPLFTAPGLSPALLVLPASWLKDQPTTDLRSPLDG